MDAQRLGGGLLGADHSWVAGPSESSAADSSTPAADAGQQPARQQQQQQPPPQQQQRLQQERPNRAAEVGWMVYNWVEDAREVLSQELEFRASGRGMVYTGAALLVAAWIARHLGRSG